LLQDVDNSKDADKLQLVQRLHSLLDDIGQAVGGGIADRCGHQEAVNKGHKSLVDNKRDVDPSYKNENNPC
jgi:hypothetical protein